jgi:hypothetical protein
MPDTSNPDKDNESPDCIALRRNDALCQRRLQSGLGDGGRRSETWRQFFYFLLLSWTAAGGIA